MADLFSPPGYPNLVLPKRTIYGEARTPHIEYAIQGYTVANIDDASDLVERMLKFLLSGDNEEQMVLFAIMGVLQNLNPAVSEKLNIFWVMSGEEEYLVELFRTQIKWSIKALEAIYPDNTTLFPASIPVQAAQAAGTWTGWDLTNVHLTTRITDEDFVTQFNTNPNITDETKTMAGLLRKVTPTS